MGIRKINERPLGRGPAINQNVVLVFGGMVVLTLMIVLTTESGKAFVASTFGGESAGAKQQELALQKDFSAGEDDPLDDVLNLLEEVPEEGVKLPDVAAVEPESPLQRASASHYEYSDFTEMHAKPRLDTPKDAKRGLGKKKALPKQHRQVTVLMTKDCGHCRALMDALRSERIRFRALDITRNKKGKELFQRAGGQGVPITIVEDRYVVGNDPGKVIRMARVPKKKS